MHTLHLCGLFHDFYACWTHKCTVAANPECVHVGSTDQTKQFVFYGTIHIRWWQTAKETITDTNADAQCEQTRSDSLAYKPPIACLTYLKRWEVVVDEEGEATDRHNEELHAECVVVRVVRSTELVVHEEHGEEGGSDEEHLHTRVVQWDEVSKQIQVASREHYRKHYLTLARHTCKR